MPRKIALAAEAYLPGKCLLARAHFTRAGGIANNQTAFSDRRIHGGGRVASARAVVSGGADCAPQRDAIVSAMQQAAALDCSNITNPYGDGRASERIVAVLRALEAPRDLLRKTFRLQSV